MVPSRAMQPGRGAPRNRRSRQFVAKMLEELPIQDQGPRRQAPNFRLGGVVFWARRGPHFFFASAIILARIRSYS